MKRSIFLAFVFCLGAGTAVAQGLHSNSSQSSVNSYQSAVITYQPAVASSNSNSGRVSNEVSRSSNYNTQGHYEANTRQVSQSVNTGSKTAERTNYSNNTTNEYRYTNSGTAARNNINITAGYAPDNYITWRLKTNPAITVTGGMTRYNWVVKKPFKYYTSGTTKTRAYDHYFNKVHLKHCHPDYRPLASWMPYYDLYYSCAYFYDDFVYEIECSYPGDAGEMASFDGYIIYNHDTLSGILTIDEHKVIVEKAIDDTKEHAYTALLNDNHLNGITLFSGVKELYLVRIAGDGTKLWRVLHTGKLNIYDDNYSFPAVENIDYKKLRVNLPGEQTSPKIQNKKQLVGYINKAYGLNLNAKDYSWKTLFEYIDGLN